MLNIPEYENAKKVFHFFEEISKIPHTSENTKEIADYLENFAKERNLFCVRDEANNVIIRKCAAAGYENRPAIILQGHTDMVADKLPDASIDMLRDGLDIYRDGDFIKARGTTLGADDGIAVAYALAILDSEDIPHPEFEAVFTSDEEIGLIGATGLDGTLINGKRMINIDSDEEGIFTAGCAGGVRVDISLPFSMEDFIGKTYKLSIKGLLGGHSGIDIDKGRANAIKLIFEMLGAIGDIRIINAVGGVADNAIPTEANVIFATSYDLSDRFEEIKKSIIDKWSTIESGIDISLTEQSASDNAMSKESTDRLINLVLCEPSGVISMSEDIQGLVQTSLNLGLISTAADSVEIGFSIRSSKNCEKNELINLVSNNAISLGASVSQRGAYPAWEYRKDSPLRDKMCKIYEKMYGRAPKVITIHAGLECGIFSDKIEGLDCISIGPDNFDIHTTNEHLSISSTARVYDYLLEVLKDKEI